MFSTTAITIEDGQSLPKIHLQLGDLPSQTLERFYQASLKLAIYLEVVILEVTSWKHSHSPPLPASRYPWKSCEDVALKMSETSCFI